MKKTKRTAKSPLKIKTKSVREAASRTDGLRLFVTRLWPRGSAREDCDVWMPNLAPSEKLLRAFQSEKIDWETFSDCYLEEMQHGYVSEAKQNPSRKNKGQTYTIRLLKSLAQKQTVTLLCTCNPDAEHCHRHLLRELVEMR